jgi:two-component system, NtrC family, response regulator PilR
VPDRHAAADGEGLDLVRHVAGLEGDPPMAVITAYGSADNAVAALKAGAFDYVSKPVGLEQVRALVKSALSLPDQAESRRATTGCSAKARRCARCASLIVQARAHPGAGVHLGRVGQRQGARGAPDPR